MTTTAHHTEDGRKLIAAIEVCSRECTECAGRGIWLEPTEWLGNRYSEFWICTDCHGTGMKHN